MIDGILVPYSLIIRKGKSCLFSLEKNRIHTDRKAIFDAWQHMTQKSSLRIGKVHGLEAFLKTIDRLKSREKLLPLRV